MDLGDEIKELRKKKGMSQTDLARSLNLTPQTVSLWERKKGNPSYGNMDELEKVLGEPLRGCELVLPPPRQKKPSKDKKPVYEANKRVDVGKIRALYRAHWSIEEIARDIHIPASEVVKYLRREREYVEINAER